ncbi:MAG TPA: hypothetical protein VLT33_09905 [Labilithrix sp.]|nr:hypothetical protein [Labilithrix sp.]
MIGFVAFTTATSKPKKNDAGSRPAPDPPSTPTSPLSTTPADLDVNALNLTLACAAKPTNPGCRLLKEFDFGETWVDLPALDTLWYGEINGIGGVADAKKELYFLQAGAGSGGFFGAARTLTADNAKELADAQKLLAAVKVNSTVPNSEALKFMRGATPSNVRKGIAKTRGRSQTFLQSSVPTYIRAKGDRLLIVEFSGSLLGHEKGPGSALAWVGELFRVR